MFSRDPFGKRRSCGRQRIVVISQKPINYSTLMEYIIDYYYCTWYLWWRWHWDRNREPEHCSKRVAFQPSKINVYSCWFRPQNTHEEGGVLQFSRTCMHTAEKYSTYIYRPTLKGLIVYWQQRSFKPSLQRFYADETVDRFRSAPPKRFVFHLLTDNCFSSDV